VGALEFSIITLSLLDFGSGDKIAAILGVVPPENAFLTLCVDGAYLFSRPWERIIGCGHAIGKSFSAC
jgi:hypothetical protein